VTDLVREGDEIDIIIKRIAPDGKIALSRKDFLLRQKRTEEKSD
jgi:hypothetical protein